MADLLMLVGFCLAMLCGSFLAGILPLSINLVDAKLRFVSALGAGLLVGAALAVIIPEGIHAVDAGALDCSRNFSRTHATNADALQAATLHLAAHPVQDAAAAAVVHVDKIITDENQHVAVDADKPDTLAENIPPAGNALIVESEKPGKKRNLRSVADVHDDDDLSIINDRRHCVKRDTHSMIGLSLVLGFVLMLIIDYFSIKRQQSQQQHHHRGTENHVTATLGLVVHAAADGIALGASALTSEVDLEIIVFLAIMLHKTPAAFGLVSFLLHEGVDRQSIRKHLLVFSLAAPVMALLTFGFIQIWNQSYNVDSNSITSLSPLSTGCVLLFSGGTFLYVATVHVLPEIAHLSPHQHSSSSNSHTAADADADYQKLLVEDDPTTNDAGDNSTSVRIVTQHQRGAKQQQQQLHAVDMFALIAGCLCPLLFAMGHSH